MWSCGSLRTVPSRGPGVLGRCGVFPPLLVEGRVAVSSDFAGATWKVCSAHRQMQEAFLAGVTLHLLGPVEMSPRVTRRCRARWAAGSVLEDCLLNEWSAERKGTVTGGPCFPVMTGLCCWLRQLLSCVGNQVSTDGRNCGPTKVAARTSKFRAGI